LFDNQTKKGRLSGKFLAPKVTYRLRHLFGGIGNPPCYISAPCCSNGSYARWPAAPAWNSLCRKAGTTSDGAALSSDCEC